MPLLFITHREIGWWLVGLNFNPKAKIKSAKARDCYINSI
jgi:hypothetical protein